jgi:hypothetical protein
VRCRVAALRARWLGAARAIRNEAPIRRERKEGSPRRWRRIGPKNAPFCFGGRPAAPMLASVVRQVRDRVARTDPVPVSDRVRATASVAARPDSLGWVVRPCRLLWSPPSASFLAAKFATWSRETGTTRLMTSGTSTAQSRWDGLCLGAWNTTLPQYRSAGHFSAHVMPDRPCVASVCGGSSPDGATASLQCGLRI